MAVLDVKTVAENLQLVVIEHEAEDLIIDNALGQLGGAAKELLDVKDGAHFAADFVEQKQRIGLRANAFEQARVFDGHGEAAGQQGEDALLVAGEIVQVAALNIEHADAFAADHQRNSQLRAHAVNGIDVAWIFRGVADANRVAGGRSRAGDSLSQRDAQVFRQIARIADGEPVLQITSGGFDHEHAENLVIDDALDERRRAREDLVEIQR